MPSLSPLPEEELNNAIASILDRLSKIEEQVEKLEDTAATNKQTISQNRSLLAASLKRLTFALYVLLGFICVFVALFLKYDSQTGFSYGASPEMMLALGTAGTALIGAAGFKVWSDRDKESDRDPDQ